MGPAGRGRGLRRVASRPPAYGLAPDLRWGRAAGGSLGVVSAPIVAVIGGGQLARMMQEEVNGTGGK